MSLVFAKRQLERLDYKKLYDKLYESFQENQYPTQEKKESLAQELGLTYRQVDKWFINWRHSFRVSAKEAHSNGVPSPNKGENSANIGHATHSDKPDGSVVQSCASKGVKREDNQRLELSMARRMQTS